MGDGFSATERVECTVDEAWSCLTDWKRAPEWMTGIDELNVVGDEAIRQGTRLTFRSRGADRESEIVEWDPPQRLTLKSKQGGMTAVYEYACASDGSGTRLSLHAHCEAEGIGWRIASPLIQFMMKRTDSGQIAGLKRVIETRDR